MNWIKMTFSVEINAPRERVWDVMFDDRGYREWTSAFSAGSFFEGSWSEGSAIRFLGPDEKGELGGFASRIVSNKPFEQVWIEHRSVVKNGVEECEPSAWTGAREDYYLSETNGVTTLRIEQDMVPEYEPMFQTMWPGALKKLKALAERTV